MRSASEKKIANRALQAINRLYCRVYHQLDVLSPCTLPCEGPAILVCNHTSGLDPLLIQSVCPRMIIWMMAAEYYNLRGIKWVYETIEAIPVARSGRDMAATRAAMRALRDGRILGIFPEGRIETSRELLPFQSGVALIAEKSQAAVYPVFLDGTQRNLPMIPALGSPQRACIAFGPPIPPDSRPESLEEKTAAVQAGVEGLKIFTDSCHHPLKSAND
ncbi:MAG: 1-acyl-sn-glycerol-3-phosphate acyltransferase [Phycisphaerae bacterium]|nr:1-acyl-sn-glycerol-3-phosphate acyltransferase [Phycisphaerae bacterium]